MKTSFLTEEVCLLSKKIASEVAKELEKKKWRCIDGGEHVPIKYFQSDEFKPVRVRCLKCDASLRARWEKYE